ncbi:hypothetical protein ACR6EC_23705 [Bacillus subtilis]
MAAAGGQGRMPENGPTMATNMAKLQLCRQQGFRRSKPLGATG